MILQVRYAIFTTLISFVATISATGVSHAVDTKIAPAKPAEYTAQGLLDAAYNHCATVQNRHAKSCDCEQKLLSDPKRFGAEEREMAFYYFIDQERFKKEFESRIAADPKWHEGFVIRMSNMNALITAACGA